MAARRPDLNRAFHIRIVNWGQYVGTGKRGRIKSPLFIKKPVDFFHSSRLQMEPGLYRFFDYLIYIAARQDIAGEISGTFRGLSRDARCTFRKCSAYVSRLSEMQLIQDLSDLPPPRREEKKREEVVVVNKGNATQSIINPPQATDNQKLFTTTAINDFWLIEVWNQNRGELPAVTEVDPRWSERIRELQGAASKEKWAEAIASFAASNWALGKTEEKTFPSRFDFLLRPGFLDKAASALKKKNNAAERAKLEAAKSRTVLPETTETDLKAGFEVLGQLLGNKGRNISQKIEAAEK